MNLLSDSLLTLLGIRNYESLLKRTQYFTENEIKEYQGKHLRLLLTHCKSNISWYSTQFRKFGVNPNGDDPFYELSKLPILKREEVRDNHAYFCMPGAGKSGLRFSTSGTTGEPLNAFTSREQWIVEQGIIWRQWKWAGYNFRDKMAIFRSYAPKVDQPHIKIDKLKNWAYFSVFRMDDNAINEYARFLQRWKPRFLRGYPSSLLLVAQHAIRYGWKLPGLKAAFSASETAPKELRDALRDAFGIELFDHYGQAEITCMFHDCEDHQGMHVDWEYGFVELIPSAEKGLNRIIATNLHNNFMPLLRYDTGDLSDGEWHQCSCSRTSPIIRSIHGRKDDFIISTDGSRISTVNLYTFFSKLGEVRQFQITQNTPGELSVNISYWDNNCGESLLAHSIKIKRELEVTTGLIIHIKNEPNFVRSREGKTPMFIQRISK